MPSNWASSDCLRILQWSCERLADDVKFGHIQRDFSWPSPLQGPTAASWFKRQAAWQCRQPRSTCLLQSCDTSQIENVHGGLWDLNRGRRCSAVMPDVPAAAPRRNDRKFLENCFWSNSNRPWPEPLEIFRHLVSRLPMPAFLRQYLELSSRVQGCKMEDFDSKNFQDAKSVAVDIPTCLSTCIFLTSTKIFHCKNVENELKSFHNKKDWVNFVRMQDSWMLF